MNKHLATVGQKNSFLTSRNIQHGRTATGWERMKDKRADAHRTKDTQEREPEFKMN